jgi:hypothetical protein
MPAKPETDPLILEQRMQRHRDKARLRSQKHRAKSKQLATTLLGQALERVAGSSNPGMSIEENQFLAQRTAQAILKGTLRRHGVTIERLVKAGAEALEAMKLTRAGETALRPDWGNRLRAIETFLRLFQNIGEIPDSKHREPHVPISVKVLVVGENYEELRVLPTNPGESE